MIIVNLYVFEFVHSINDLLDREYLRYILIESVYFFTQQIDASAAAVASKTETLEEHKKADSEAKVSF